MLDGDLESLEKSVFKLVFIPCIKAQNPSCASPQVVNEFLKQNMLIIGSGFNFVDMNKVKDSGDSLETAFRVFMTTRVGSIGGFN